MSLAEFSCHIIKHKAPNNLIKDSSMRFIDQLNQLPDLYATVVVPANKNIMFVIITHYVQWL